MRTHHRVTHCAGTGHSHLVTRSVTPLYAPENVSRSSASAPLVGDRENEGPIEFLQPGFVALRDLVERHGGDVRRESRPRSTLQPGGDRCDLIRAHVRATGDGSPVDIHFQQPPAGF